MAGRRPELAIAHVVAKTWDVAKTTEFYLKLGLRKVWQADSLSILELRGGTHILFFRLKKKPARAPKADFDLMVDDVRKFHARLKRAKLRVGEIKDEKFSGHLRFEVVDPDGRRVSIFSSHCDGREV